MHNTIPYNTIQYNTIQYNTIQYNTIQYNTCTYTVGTVIATVWKRLSVFNSTPCGKHIWDVPFLPIKGSNCVYHEISRDVNSWSTNKQNGGHDEKRNCSIVFIFITYVHCFLKGMFLKIAMLINMKQRDLFKAQRRLFFLLVSIYQFSW